MTPDEKRHSSRLNLRNPDGTVHRVEAAEEIVGHVPVPFNASDLRQALHLVYPSAEANEIADSLIAPGLDAPGSMWVGDIMLWAALLSPQHEESIRGYLQLSREQMSAEMTRVRAWLARRPNEEREAKQERS